MMFHFIATPQNSQEGGELKRAGGRKLRLKKPQVEFPSRTFVFAASRLRRRNRWAVVFRSGADSGNPSVITLAWKGGRRGYGRKAMDDPSRREIFRVVSIS